MPLTYGSVCSGIESISCAWHPLGMRPQWFAEVAAFPSRVLAERWPDVRNLELDWMTRVVTSPSSFFGLLVDSAPDGWFGRTSPECCLPIAATHSVRSSRSWSSSGMASAGECWTLSTSACPSDAVASSLSAILETGDHLSRYFLSARACAGILERAHRRGRRLPPLLERALTSAASLTL